MTVRPGTAYLVGAGPGHAGLITVRGRDLLRRADVVLHDRLVDPALLDEAPPGALIESVGKSSRGDSGTQEVINAAIVRHALAGRVVVRLKGGDPLVFGRGWEELLACRDAGVPCEIVPGVSSALAAPAAAGIPATLRGVASSAVIVAGTALLTSPDPLPRADTTIVLMGVGELDAIAARLIASGIDPQTPAALVEQATCPGERVVSAALAEIARLAVAEGVAAPAVLVVGLTVAELQRQRRVGPLAGCRVVITRPHEAARELADNLRAAGADVIAAPLIRITYAQPDVTRALAHAGPRPWIAFTSRHGVRGFRGALEHHAVDVRALGSARLASVGPVTSRELLSWGLRPDVQPDVFRADALVDALRERVARHERVLFPSGTLALDTLPRGLRAAGLEVTPIEVYHTQELPLAPRAHEAIARGVDAVLLASPSAARALGASGVQPGSAVAVCIGETTAAAARAQGWSVRVASTHTDAGMIAELIALRSTAVAA
ncbi:MAG: uroporphyrinogen-III C-methyltransferase [Gemmatimonadaceae bacterium]|nr:uroporphyrinogen-III C-methyltransferase [Gemmatimonadaceae bacterium]